MKKKLLQTLLLLGSLFFINTIAFSQGAPACPEVNAGPDQTICQGQSATLNATLVTNHKTTSYSVSSIPYAPYAYSGGTAVSVGTDDIWSSGVTLPFNFCYFGNTYSECWLGSNGQLTFTNEDPGPFGFNQSDLWQITTGLPSTANMPGNTICAVFRDIDPSYGGRMAYYLTGTAPCRALVVYWKNIPLYGKNDGDCPSASNSTFELVLYENTNYIDVYVNNSYNCTGWNGGYGIIGIQNAAGTVAYTPPNRNYPSTWSTTNEAWRFTPTGAPSYTFNWYNSTAPTVSLGTNPTMIVSPTTTTTYIGKMVLTNCDGTTVTEQDEVTVNVNPAPTVSVNNVTVCSGNSGTLNATVSPTGGTYSWSPGGGTGSSMTASPGSTTSYTVTYTANGCPGSGTGTITVNNGSVTATGGTLCAGGSTTLTASGSPTGGTYSWSPATGLSGTTGASVTASPGSTTTYTVTYTSPSGCVSTATATATVNPLPTITATGGTICNGDNTTLTASGGNSYTWSPATGLSGTTGASVTASPTSTTTYTVTGTDANGCVNTATATVTVNPIPTVSVNSAAVCSGTPVTLTATVNPTGGTYNWSPGGQTTGSITVSPSTTTTYSVTYTANGCSATGAGTITINPNLTPTASSNSPICDGATLNLSVTSGGTGATYSWTGPNSFTSSAQNPTISGATPAASGTYTVTVTSSSGCTGTTTTDVTVNPLPTITATGGTICNGDNTTLTASGGSSYTWSPATGLSGTTGASVTASPTSTTTYTVTGTDGNGCVNTATATVTVNPIPTVSVNSAAVCSGTPVTLTATVNPTGGTYNWSPGGQTTGSITVSPSTTTTYSVTYTANGCSATGAGTVSINPNLTPTASSNSPICDGTTLNLSVTSGGAGATYSWTGPNSFTSSAQNPTISGATPAASGTYTVTVTSSSGCTGTTTTNVTVNPLPTITATDETICTGTSTTLTASGGSSYTWSPATGLSGTTGASVTASPTTTTSYEVVGTDANGCVDSDAVTVTVNPLPTIDAGTDVAICTGTSTTLTASGGSSYTWSPATGLSGTTGASVTASPTTTTSYEVVGTDANGCVDSDAVTVTVNPNLTPTASNNSPICDGVALNLSVTSGGTGATYSWTGPNSFTSSAQNPTISGATPAASGTYTVTVTNGTGCSGATTTNVTVNPLPTPTVGSNSPICEGTALNLTATGGTSYSWTGPNGFTSSTQNPTISNAGTVASGTYKVVVTDANGCVDSTTTAVTVNPNPVADFTVQDACKGFPVVFTDQSTGDVTSWSWDVDNNGTTDYTTQNASNTYSGYGTFQVHLTVTTAEGCTDDTLLTATVYNNPTAQFSAPAVCEGDTMEFTDQSTPSPTSWSWDFGDGNTSTSQNPIHNYAGAGSYTVKLTISSGGCTDDTTATVTVNPNPVVDFSWVSACPGTATAFNNGTTVTTGNSYSWNFGDGTGTSTSASPTYSYDSGGIYSVQLIATSPSGCMDSVTHSVSIPYLPVAYFSFDTVCLGTQSCFEDQSTVENSTITSWTWSWGDGTPAGSLQNPCHSYTAAGTYTVIMTPVSAEGCIAASPATHQVIVNDMPTAMFTVNNVCQNAPAVFTNTSTNNSSNQWDFGDGDTSVAINPQHQYAAAGTYNVTLTAIAGTGCQADTTIPVTIYPMPTADFTQTNVCDGVAMNFTDNSEGNGGTLTGWSWSFGDGNTDTQENPNHTYGTPGDYPVKVIVTTSDNCSDTITKTVEVYPNPTADFSPTQVCLGTPTTFVDQSTVSTGSITGWSWAFGGTPAGTSSNQNPTYTYNTSGTFNVKLTITTNNGCTDSITQAVTVNPNPVANFTGANLSGCTPWCAELTDSSNIQGGTITSWQWDLGDGSIKTGQDVTACYTNTGLGVDQYTIKLIVTSDEGCKDSTTKADYISVYPHPSAAFTMDPKQGDTYHNKIHFIDESQGAASWAWTFGDGGASTMENPLHEYQDSGTYMVRLAIANQWGCTDTAYNPIRINPVFSIFIPNAFTPDGDGKNDTFYPQFYGVKQMDMYIFNRWGQIIYEGHQLNSQWDGKDKGKMSPPDVYVYKIIVMDFRNKSHTYIGHVTVVR